MPSAHTAAPVPTPESRPARPLNAAIIGGGKGCESFLRMVAEDKLGHFRMKIRGVAEPSGEAPGMCYARELGVELVTRDYRELYDIPELDLLIELTGKVEVRDEVERTRPRHVRLIDHFAAALFWEVSTAQQAAIRHRNEARRRVEAERDRVAQIFDCIPDEIVVMDRNQVVQDVNASFLKNNMTTIEVCRGKHCYELEQRTRGACQMTLEGCPFFEVIKTGQSASTVVKHFDEDGEPRYAAVVAAPMVSRDGAVVGMIESTRDITKRFRLEEKLKLTEVRLKQFMDLAPVATYIKNAQGQYVEINPAACELFGLSRAEILGKTDLEIFPRAVAEVFRASDRRVMHARRQITAEKDVTLGGMPMHLSTIKFPVLDADGQVSAVCAITRDVTDLKLAEQELTRTRDYLQNVLNNSPMIIVTTDMEGRIVSFNRGAEESLGYTSEEVIGKFASQHYRTAEERESLLRRVEREGTVRDYETHLVRKDGTLLPVSLSLSRLRDAEGKTIGTVGISKDISRRRALMDQVIQSERLAAVGRLAAGVAHEINNPLAVIGEISGYLAELLEDDPNLDDPDTHRELREGLPRVANQVKRCRSITHRLLSFARKSEAKVEQANVAAALDEILPFLSKEARLAQVTIHRDYERDLPRVRMEEMQLEEILINLIHNAIQAVSKEGKGGNIWLRTERDNGKLVIIVQDDGPGIAPEVRKRLFDPFVTTKAPGEGTGLGLSICYGIVKRYDGAINVESGPEGGATFKVILPVAE